jgi:outer membrane lipoprotein SlyB
MNSKVRFLPVAGAAVLALAMAGCSTTDLYGPNSYPGPAPVTYPSSGVSSQPVAAVEYGRVMNVSLVSGQPSSSVTSNRGIAGAAIGAVVGGLIGSQIGGGSGRAAATVLGAAGGAVAGNQIARRNDGTYNTAQPVYRIEVQTDSGAIRTYDVAATGDLRPGDRVRIENGVIYLA